MPDSLIQAIAEAAEAWRDPDYAPRAEAVERTLRAANRFTEEALAFALNQRMHHLTSSAMQQWIAGRQARTPCTVGVFESGATPLDGLPDLLAILLTGHLYAGVRADASPYLLPAFVEEIRSHFPEVPVAFGDPDWMLGAAERLIATGGRGDENGASGWEAMAESHGIPPERCLLRPACFAVAVLDGLETADEREGLAEDVLLHEGQSPHGVALVWAPHDLAPDPYLDAFADFRGVFPTHSDSPGNLRMQQAFLAATGQPHAYGDGLEFLVSRGTPEPQPPGHLRWVPYDHVGEFSDWLDTYRPPLAAVVARPALAERLRIAALPPGEAHRPILSSPPCGPDVVRFLVTP